MEGPTFLLSPRATQVLKSPEASHMWLSIDGSQPSTKSPGPVLPRRNIDCITPQNHGCDMAVTSGTFYCPEASHRFCSPSRQGVAQEHDSLGVVWNCTCLRNLEKGNVRGNWSLQGHRRETSARAWTRRLQSSKKLKHKTQRLCERKCRAGLST